VILTKKTREAHQALVFNDLGPHVRPESQAFASFRPSDALDEREDLAALVVYAQETRRGREADGLQVLQEQVYRRRPRIHRPSDSAADANNATMRRRFDELLHNTTVRCRTGFGRLAVDRRRVPFPDDIPLLKLVVWPGWLRRAYAAGIFHTPGEPTVTVCPYMARLAT
jgi:hypothetical protein